MIINVKFFSINIKELRTELSSLINPTIVYFRSKSRIVGFISPQAKNTLNQESNYFRRGLKQTQLAVSHL